LAVAASVRAGGLNITIGLPVDNIWGRTQGRYVYRTDIGFAYSGSTLASITIGGSAAASAIVIGTAPELLTAAIDADLASAKARGEVHEIVAFDAPKRALQKLINEDANESVGGSVQQAQATPFGFRIIANMVPITPKPPSPRNAGLFVLGHDTFDMQYVGQHMVSFEGR
jgi:hypothetical protein